MAQFDIHQTVTNSIIATLEAGEAGQWTCPWHRRGGGLPRNALTGKAYRGINTLSLWVGAQAAGYSDDRWATYRQWGELGAQVRKGEKSTLVVFWKDLGKDEEDRPRFVARASYAFNASQVEGAPEAGEPLPPSEWVIPEVFEGFVDRTNATIIRGGEMACYIPSQDLIRIPSQSRFPEAHGYASTMLHELVHWSGAKGRLDRDLSGRFKTQAYAAEELIAELGSAFLCAELGLEATPHPTHASYLASWLTLLRSDPKAIFTAASAASRAASYLTALQSQMAEAA
ncbi:Antirestriction protein ArdC [Methylobacterium phyllostachyos]|uniref:Antirestriction protein ArdC n=1 Tax=Methylobacterium phyllostachyos TaxID=582672 RepID=A0A1G9V9X8_9HYPH|nr:zincin-like metallopeptidase domain-containing protein [Methylobacterium phyllostachyos]SDM68979.1 Antirestriction protein ArdC [Methylobacterium phyllostachyos]